MNAGKPWLEAGGSHLATAERLLTHHLATSSWWERLSIPAEVAALRARAKACRTHARRLDRLHARGWLVFHDQVLANTGEVLDHVLIGPTGLAVLYTLPSLDHHREGWPGPRTSVEADAAMERWQRSVQDRVLSELNIATMADSFDHSVHINARVVLPNARRANPNYDAYLVPDQVLPWLTGGFPNAFNAFQVQQLAGVVNGFIVPARASR